MTALSRRSFSHRHASRRPRPSSIASSYTTEVIAQPCFHSSLARENFPSRFVNRSVHACERVYVESFKVEQLGFIDYLLRSPCEKLLALGDEHCPKYVHMSYANVQVAKTRSAVTLECQVKYTRFTLTVSNLAHILDLPTVQ